MFLNEYDRLLDEQLRVTITNDVFVDTFVDVERNVDRANEIKDTIKFELGLAALMTSILIPGSTVGVAIMIADGVAGEVDGIIKIRQGDVKEGIVEIGFSALEIYGGVQQGIEIYNSVDDVPKIIQEDYSFRLNEQAIDESEYLNVSDEYSSFGKMNNIEGRKHLEIQKLGNTSEPNYSGMAQQDVINYKYSDSKVLEYQSLEKVDYDEVLNIYKNEPGYNIIETNKIENVVDDAAASKMNESLWNTEAKPIFNGGSKTSYGKSSEISEQKMYQQGQHFNKHGREMGYTGKKEYEQAARDFFKENRDTCEIYEGIFNSAHGN